MDELAGDDVRRYAPELSLPPYAYLPGRDPHPVRDPRGHSFGCAAASEACPDPERPMGSAAFRAGIDLFNLGYYWEAHEAWERLWVACGRSGAVADALKGLIKLAAAGVKARAGSTAGVVRHAKRAATLFAAVQRERPRCLGLDLGALRALCEALQTDPPSDRDPQVSAKPVLGIALKPDLGP